MMGLSTPRSAITANAVGSLLLLALFFVSGVYTVRRVEERFYVQGIRAREMMVAVLAGSAKIPLLGDDSLFIHRRDA